MKWLDALTRLLNGVLDAINRKNKKDAANDAANTIANGSRVRKSEQSFDDLADKSKRDSVE